MSRQICFYLLPFLFVLSLANVDLDKSENMTQILRQQQQQYCSDNISSEVR